MAIKKKAVAAKPAAKKPTPVVSVKKDKAPKKAAKPTAKKATTKK